MLIKMPTLLFGFRREKMCDKPSFAAIFSCLPFLPTTNNILTGQVGQKQQATGSCLATKCLVGWMERTILGWTAVEMILFYRFFQTFSAFFFVYCVDKWMKMSNRSLVCWQVGSLHSSLFSLLSSLFYLLSFSSHSGDVFLLKVQ